jgi:hypothetical protein
MASVTWASGPGHVAAAMIASNIGLPRALEARSQNHNVPALAMIQFLFPGRVRGRATNRERRVRVFASAITSTRRWTRCRAPPTRTTHRATSRWIMSECTADLVIQPVERLGQGLVDVVSLTEQR